MKKTLLLSFSALVALAVNSQQLISTRRGSSENSTKTFTTKKEKALAPTLVCNTPYVVGTTMDLNFTFDPGNTLGENIVDFSILFPAGIMPNTSANNTDPLMPIQGTDPAALNPISGQTISWTSPDPTWGGITGSNGPIKFKVNVTISAGVTGNKTATFTAEGDGWVDATSATNPGFYGAPTVSNGNVTILDDAIPIYNANAVYVAVQAYFQKSDGNGVSQNCSLTEVPVACRIVNNGNKPITNLLVSYKVGSNAKVTETVAGPIAKGDSLTYYFTKKITAPQGFYTVVGIVDLPNDIDKMNDTTSEIAFANSLPTKISSTTTYSNGFEGNYDMGSCLFDYDNSSPFGYSTQHKHSGAGALFFTASRALGYPVGTYSTYAVLPCMEVVAGAQYVISFWKKSNSGTAPLVVNGETAILSGKTPDFRKMDTIKPFSPITPNLASDLTWTRDSVYYVAKENGVRYFAIGARAKVTGSPTAGDFGNIRIDDVTIRQSKVSGLNELNVTSFSVYPNPANDIVTVSLSENTMNGTIRLFSADGKVIETRNYSNSSVETFDVKSLNSGVYFFQIGNTTEKVIIK
jgi:hypothetical protein